jgi:hypothetical protein
MKISVVLSLVALTVHTVHGANEGRVKMLYPAQRDEQDRRRAKSSKMSKAMAPVCYDGGMSVSGKSSKCPWTETEVYADNLQKYLDDGYYNGTCATTACNDNDECTVDDFNITSCCSYQPLTCPLGQTCDSKLDDSDLCTVDTWDSLNQVCVFTNITCLPGQRCNNVSGCICDDGDICTQDTFDAVSQVCVFTPLPCGLDQSCDPADG